MSKSNYQAWAQKCADYYWDHKENAEGGPMVFVHDGTSDISEHCICVSLYPAMNYALNHDKEVFMRGMRELVKFQKAKAVCMVGQGWYTQGELEEGKRIRDHVDSVPIIFCNLETFDGQNVNANQPIKFIRDEMVKPKLEFDCISAGKGALEGFFVDN
jgi:hypothetical protein